MTACCDLTLVTAAHRPPSALEIACGVNCSNGPTSTASTTTTDRVGSAAKYTTCLLSGLNPSPSTFTCAFSATPSMTTSNLLSSVDATYATRRPSGLNTTAPALGCSAPGVSST